MKHASPHGTGKDKARWSTAKKAAARKTKNDKLKAEKADRREPVEPRKKARWVDGKPARPESADKGKRRGHAERDQDRRPRREGERAAYDERRPARRDEGFRPREDKRRPRWEQEHGTSRYGRDDRPRDDRARDDRRWDERRRDDRGGRPDGARYADRRPSRDGSTSGRGGWNRDDRRDDRREDKRAGERREWSNDRLEDRRDDRSGQRREWSSDRRDRGDDRSRDDRPRSDRHRDDRRRDDWRTDDRRPDDRRGERREWNRDARDSGPRDSGQRDSERRDFGRRDGERREGERRDAAYGDRPAKRPVGWHSDGPRLQARPMREERSRAWRTTEPTFAPSASEAPVEGDAVVAASEGNESTAPASTTHSGVLFADLGLPEAMVAALGARGIRHAFPIQAATIPDSLAGRDLLGRGQTGSGKTLAFGLPTLTRLRSGRSTPNRPRAIVLVPTRELALQVADALEPISRAVGVSQKVVAGGMPYPPQLMALDRGVDLVVATPGRLQDLIERGAAVLDNVDIVILDEADHMADLGFLPEVTEILDLVPEGGQRLLFSATLDKGIDELASKYLVDPVTHSTDDPTAAVSTMEHRILLIEPSMKKTLTAQISGRPGKTLIFVRTQLGADRVAGQLRESGIMAGPIHGGLNQSVRNKVLEAFKDGRLSVLVATDVAARGIHVDDVSQVVQVDPPADHKTYVHRAGRTARAGSAGSVVTLALPHQRKAMERIVDEVALSISPERLDNASAAAEGIRPTGAPVPEAWWQEIIAPRPQRGRRGPGRPRPDGARRPRRDGVRGDGPRRPRY